MSMQSTPPRYDFDAVVIGAGFAGLYMVHRLRNLMGLSVLGIDKADGVGGTWYWNRYPGALSDTESHVYRYSFDPDLLADGAWSTRYIDQPTILRYLEDVADRYDLRRSFVFGASVTKADFQEDRGVWQLETDRGQTVTARYLVTGLGLLSDTNIPKIKGSESFLGRRYHSGAWPSGVDLTNQRVGVIGTGSTGVQIITDISPRVRHLTVFQRSPQYIVPARNGPVPQTAVDDIKASYGEIWRDVRESVVAFGFSESQVPAMSVSEEERRRVFQRAWDEGGGFRFMFGTFCDIATDRKANEAAAEFIRNKISQIVLDPATARKLTPTNLYATRPLCDSGYYETFNRENVTLVDVKSSPITEITPAGIRTVDGEYPLDVLIYATGFDAVDGSYGRISIRGRKGLALKQKWAAGPSSLLGIANADFPNLFMILGPNGPFTNLPPAIECQVEWIADLIKHAESRGLGVIEARADSESAWMATCREIAGHTLFAHADSWIFGANIPGKSRSVMFYMAGLGAYRQRLAEVERQGYKDFELH